MSLMKTVVISVFVCVFGTLNAQNVEFKSSNFKADKETFKKVVNDMKTGDEFFVLGNEAVFNTRSPKDNFKKALRAYMPAQKFNPNNAELNFKIGVCFAHSNYKYRCPTFFKKASELDAKADPFLSYYLGYAYQLEGKYNESCLKRAIGKQIILKSL